MKFKVLFVTILYSTFIYAQDLSQGLSVNDTGNYPQQDILKPSYLGTIIDPSFGTTIRRITDAGAGNKIVPLYSTVQAWNADESLMILYEQDVGHRLLDGFTYQFIRYLDDIQPNDIEELFWDFDEPNILYYLDVFTDDFIRYNVVTQSKDILVNLNSIVTGCTGDIDMGVAIQMMSWDSDVLGFRCDNDAAYSYRISTGELTEFAVGDVSSAAPMPAPSGNLMYHRANIYDVTTGNLLRTLNENGEENSCFGKLPNGDDARFSVAFAEGPDGGCVGNIIAHNMVTGDCFEIISEMQGYPYSQPETDISALAYKNTEGGWIAASMVGYDQDGQSLLDQEIVLAKAEEGNIKVCRIAHHRSDRDEFDYWGTPHATISPSGTRVLFASDWSGAEDGQSVDCYVVELPVYQAPMLSNPPVYPGDCNMDGKVSADDAIYVNLALGSTLLPRPDASTDWIAQPAYDSGDSIQGVDLKYIDADGNGLIDTLDLAVIAQNFGSKHTDTIDTSIENIQADTSYIYSSIIIEDTIRLHEHNYHFSMNDDVSSPYNTSLVLDYNEHENVTHIYLDTTDISFEVLFVYNDTINKKFHVAIGQLIGDDYDLKIVVCEDVASLTDDIEGLILSNNTPSLQLINQIVVDSDGEKFVIDYIVNVELPEDTLENIQLFPNPVKSGNPIKIELEESVGEVQLQLQLIDIRGCIHHQSVEYLQSGDNTIHGLSTNLAKGMYFIKIIDSNNRLYTYKIMII